MGFDRPSVDLRPAYALVIRTYVPKSHQLTVIAGKTCEYS